MRRRRGPAGDRDLTGGPARLCKALGIDRRFDGHDLCATGAHLFLETGVPISELDVSKGPRVGLNRVPDPWRSLPWRFLVRPSAQATLVPA
jgi:DNA-3-methyladenine glycosylase